MKSLALFLGCAIPLIAFQSAAALPVKPKPEKPTPREKARELLENAADTSASAQPDVQASALLYIGENYDLFDHKKALDYIRRGFAATAAVPPDSQDLRAVLQSQIAGATAGISLPDAAEMLRQIQPASRDAGDHDPRQSAIQAVVSRMLAKEQIDEATELLNLIGATGQYPYRAASRIFEKLPPDDGRRITVFASAMAAYALRPAGGFSELVARHWKDVPQSMAESAVRAMVENILSRKEEEGYTVQTMSSDKGSVDFSSRQDAELFDLMHVVQAIDPKRAERILDDRPALRAALEKFPEGRASLGDSVSSNSESGSGKPDPAMRRKQMLEGLASSRADAAIKALGDETKGDPYRALALAKNIPVPSRQAEVLATIARSLSARDGGVARSALSEAVEILKDIKEPKDRIQTWSVIVEAAHRVGDDKLAWEAVDRGLADAAELYKRDTDADAPNAALRDQWPSMNAYRRVVIAASKAFGVDAEPLLLRITDPDLALLARVEMAQALLGRPHESWSTSVSRHTK